MSINSHGRKFILLLSITHFSNFHVPDHCWLLYMCPQHKNVVYTILFLSKTVKLMGKLYLSNKLCFILL